MEGLSRRRLLLLIGGMVGFVMIIVLISIVLINYRQEKYKAIIDNIEECSGGISQFSKDVLFENVYNLVDAQNNIEQIETKETYHALLRENTCETKEYNGGEIVSYKTYAIIDIEEVGYSFKIGYSWIKNSETVDLGSVEATCLSSDELIYGEFNCKDNPMILTAIELDPILNILPYFGENYIIKPRLDENEDGEYYTIVIEYNPPESVYENGEVEEFRNSRKQMATNYLINQGIKLDEYVIEETFAINR